MPIQFAFNYGIALWAKRGDIIRKPFYRVVNLHKNSEPQGGPDPLTPNFSQCMALSYWAIGELDTAGKYINDAIDQIKARRVFQEFSCWRYLRVRALEFRSDLDEMRRMIEGDNTAIPHFLSA